MPFDTLNPRLQSAATSALQFFRNRYGSGGLQIEQGIHQSIPWRPTFFLKPSKFKIIAVEVEDILYPNSLREAAYEISRYDFPIAVYQVATLGAYLADPAHKNVSLLKRHGFGIGTVDDNSQVTIQNNCVPLAQFIIPDEFELKIKTLPQKLKNPFRSAYDVYSTNEVQGLQESGQIVEAIISSMTDEALRQGAIATPIPTALAGKIDRLYGAQVFQPHRAVLGAARDFVQEYRNTSSHPARSARQAAEKLRKCRAGFLKACELTERLRVSNHQLGYPLKIHL